MNCVVPEDIHTSPIEGLFGLTPPPPNQSGNSSFASYLPLNILASETPSTLEFPMTLHMVGMDNFWNHTLQLGLIGERNLGKDKTTLNRGEGQLDELYSKQSLLGEMLTF